MIFLAKIHNHRNQAKTKGLIQGSNYKGTHDKDSTTYAVNARCADEAYQKLCKAHYPNDKRPLSGKSYLRAVKVGTKLFIPSGFSIGYTDAGDRQLSYTGEVSELYTDNAVSIHPTGYHNKFVDFGLSELVDNRVM